MSENVSNQAMMYYQLIQQGVPPQQAFAQAFPKGLPKKPGPEDLAKEQQKQAIGGIAGTVGGALGTYYLIDAISGKAVPVAAQAANAANAATAASGAANAASTGASALASSPAAQAAWNSTALTGGEAANAAWNAGATQAGGGLVGPGTTAGAEVGTLGAAAPYLGLAGAGLGAYGLYNAIESGDTGSGAMSGAALGGGLAAAAPLVGLGPVGWGGLALAAALGAGGGAGLTKLLAHESTRDVAKRHTGSLQKMGQNDGVWQRYVQGMRAQHNSAPPDPSKPYHGGQYGSWGEYQKAGLDASDLTGVYGNLKTFGPDWARYSFDDQKAITQGIIDAGLYNPKKGEVEISDAQRALQIRDAYLANKNKKPGQQLAGALR